MVAEPAIETILDALKASTLTGEGIRRPSLLEPAPSDGSARSSGSISRPDAASYGRSSDRPTRRAPPWYGWSRYHRTVGGAPML